jgi:U4/U6.U5 tri-snRNP-associated protein 1
VALVSTFASHSDNLLVAEEKEAEAADAERTMKMEDEDVGLVIDDTSEFVQSISLDAIDAKPARRVITISTVRREPSEDAMDEDDDEELEAGELDPKREEELQALKMELDRQFAEETQVKTEEAEMDVSNFCSGFGCIIDNLAV